MKTQPLVRLLTDAGYGSRRKVANLVKAGAVQVNNRLASSFTEPVDIERDSVSVSGQEVGPFKPQRIYLMMHKPAGVLSTTEDDRGRRTVIDLLPEKYREAGLYPAGRLDEDSTGLLILTNDGDLTHELTHPRFEHEKEYHVTVEKPLKDEAFHKLETGVEIEGQMTWPARVHAIKESDYDGECIYSVTIHEGRKRQVRRMFQILGHEVMSLKRVRTGSLILGPLQEGEFRELKEKELKALMRKGGAQQDMRDTQTSPQAAARGPSYRTSA
ncbi:MAG: pseudouridine synthase, partial [Chloroflexota bacterium]